MSALLLDVNVLVALLWPEHTFHELVQAWFGKNARRGWATCPITQGGFVRLVSNPSFSAQAVSPSDAARALDLTLKHPAHRFWPDEIPITDALGTFGKRVAGHQQVTDAYLLSLAIHNKGKLVTLDQSIVALPGRDDPRANAVEVISARKLN
jgi:toxin-antitoxin system PIN domain toxin